MNEDIERIPYLDGLRGAAVLTIFWGHLVISLFPSVVTHDPPDVHTPFDLPIGVTPLAILWNANFGICIFFVLSGYVLSHFCARSRMSFQAKLLRRYLRLALPIIITSTLAWLLFVLGLYDNSAASEITRSGWLGGWYHFDPSFLNMATEALYGTFASGSDAYNPNLWPMQIALAGSVYVFLFQALFRTPRVRLLILVVFALLHTDDYLVLFAAGALLYDGRWVLDLLSAKGWDFAPLALFVVGALLGSAPALTGPGVEWLSPVFQGTQYTIVLSLLQHAEILHEIGAAVLFAGLLSSGMLQRLFGSPVLLYLGRISFVLYLIEIPVICSVMSWVVLYFPYDTPYLERAAFAAGITMVAVVGLAALLDNFAEIRMTAWSRAAGDWLDRVFEPEPELPLENQPPRRAETPA